MKNEKFEHYILTCFNIDRGFDYENKRNSPEYLDSRFDIFESITIPSVISQLCSNFSWIVFFDIDTPNKYKKIVKTLLKSVNLIAYYIKDKSEIKDILRNNLHHKTKYLITTNLDNDDAISENFIQIIQSKLKFEEEVYLINFLMGYMITDRGLFMREYYSSPFHTLSEKVSNEIITCLDIPHPFLFRLQQKGVSLYQIICKPVWLQIVHESNVHNKIDTNAIPIFNLESLKDFKIKELPFSLKTSSINQTNRFNLAFSWFKKKKKKSLNFKLKLALYTLIPQISILFNKYKLQTSAQKRLVKHKYSLREFRELLLDLPE